MAQQGGRHFTHIFGFTTACYIHFTDEAAETLRTGILAKVIQLVNGKFRLSTLT